MHDDDDSVFAAMRAGARGHVLKGASQRELVQAIQAVARRGHLRPLGGQPRAGYFTGRKPTLAQPFPELTTREQEVLGLIAKGLNNAAIGQRLQLAPKTVRNLASSVFAKLQVADRAQAMRRALDEGLGPVAASLTGGNWAHQVSRQRLQLNPHPHSMHTRSHTYHHSTAHIWARHNT